MGLLGIGIKAIGGLLVRKVTSTDAMGIAKVRRKATPFTKTMVYIISTALVYQMILWPIMNYHWPHYGFPPIDVTAILAILGGM